MFREILPAAMLLAAVMSSGAVAAKSHAQDPFAPAPDAPATQAAPTGLPPGVKFAPAMAPGGQPGTTIPGKPPQAGKAGGKPPAKAPAKAGEKPSEKPKTKTVTRPPLPATPPDPKELLVKPDEKGMVSVQFHGQPWPNVMDWLADNAKLSLDWQELPGDYLNLTTRRAYTVEETMDLVNQRLLNRGYTILREPEGLTVVKVDKLNPAAVPRVKPDELDGRMPHEFVKVSFPLKWMIAADAVKELDTMKSSNGKLTALHGTNRIEAMDAVINLREIHRLLIEEQSPESMQRLAKEFQLEFTRAAEVAEQLKSFLGGESSNAPRPMTPQQMQMAAQRAQMMAAQNPGGQPPKQAARPSAAKPVRVVANLRRNSILVQAPPDKMAIASAFIKLVDVENDLATNLEALEVRMRVYRLAALDPVKIVETLNELGGLEPRTQIRADSANRALIVYGSVADHYLIQSVIDRLDGSGRKFEVVQLRRLRAEDVAGSIAFLMGAKKGDEKDSGDQGEAMMMMFGYPSRRRSAPKSSDSFRVTANIEFNQLLLWANDIELSEVTNLLKKLGEISAPGEGRSRVRTLDVGTGEQLKEFLKRLEQTWKNIGPNPLILPAEEDIPVNPRTQRPGRKGPDSKDAAAEPKDASPNRPSSESPSSESPSSESPSSESPSPESPSPESPSPKSPSPKSPSPKSPSPKSPSPKSPSSTGEPKPSVETAALGSVAFSVLTAVQDSPEIESPSPPAPLPPKTDADLQREAVRKRLEQLRDEARRSNYERDAKAASSIRISISPDGRLIVASQDVAALNLLEQLIEELAPPRKPFEVFHLKYAPAYWVKLNLEDYFEEEEEEQGAAGRDRMMMMMYGVPPAARKIEGPRLGKRRPPRFIDDLDTNSILVKNADSRQLAIVAELIEIYDVPEPTSAQDARVTKLFHIRYSMPSIISATLKEAYRDLLSSNDKALQNAAGGEQKKRPSTAGTTFISNYGTGEPQEERQKNSRISFKGKLSLGADDITKTLLVSCEGEILMGVIGNMIEALDQAAKPVGTVQVVNVNGNVNLARIRQALGAVIQINEKPVPGQQPQPANPNGKAPPAQPPMVQPSPQVFESPQ